MADFNRVVIHARYLGEIGRIAIAVHPFAVPRLYIMRGPDDFDAAHEIPTWQREMLNALWHGVPGAEVMYVSNGEVAIHHSQIFSNDELGGAAIDIIRPYLETALKLQQLET